MTGKGGRAASLRSRLPVVAVVVACVAGVVAAVTGAANPVSAVQFLLPGHWVYNSALQSVFHIDGSTGNVDVRAGVPGEQGDQTFQGDTSGYVVGRERVTEFDKSSLEVGGSTGTPSLAVPVGVETAGGPYLVYQEDGQVVRLGDPSVVLSFGGPVGMPVASRDGTLWLPRTSAGHLCRLSAGEKAPVCDVSLPAGHGGALALVGNRLVFVDTTDDTLHVVESDKLGDGRDLGFDVPDDARFATTDLGGRLAILDGLEMHFADTGLDGGEQDPLETVSLDEGEYTGPVSTGSVVAVVNRTTGTLITFDVEGNRGKDKPLPADNGEPRLTRGEDDRIYVDGEKGTHVVVVDEDGGVKDVPVEADSGKEKKAPPTGGKDPDANAPVPPKPDDTEQPKDNPGQQRENPRKPPQQQKPPGRQEQPPQVPPSQPGAPTGVRATAGNGTATVSWGPAQPNRSAVTSYRITWNGGETTAGGGARSVTIPSLVNGTTYTFAVTAVNGVGAGPAMASNPVTPAAPATAPSPPVNPVAGYDPATRDATLSWGAPAVMGTGEFSHYLVGVTGRAEVVVPGTSTTFTALEATGTITFTVKAVTTGPGGQPLVSPAASTTVEAPPQEARRLTLRRGEPTTEHCGGNPSCAWMHVEAFGFPPDTDITFMPHSTDSDYSNPGHTSRTDASGFADIDEFSYYGVGHTVWVTVTFEGTEYTSNELPWEAG